MAEQSGPLPPPPPVGNIESRRSALNAMLTWANNTFQPIADEVETTDHQLTVADGTRNVQVMGLKDGSPVDRWGSTD
jgi:hypothetical protein